MIEGLLYSSCSVTERLTWKLNLCPLDLTVFKIFGWFKQWDEGAFREQYIDVAVGYLTEESGFDFAETRALNLVSKFPLMQIRPEEFCTAGRFEFHQVLV
jgi:hypothetical protein